MISKYVDDAALAKLGPGRRAMMAAVFCLLAFCFPATAEGDTAEDLIGMGLELYQNRSYQEALEAYDEALLLSPDDPRAWMGKGKVFSALGDYNQSLLAYQNATRISPDDPEAWFGVGLNRFLLHDLNDSLKASERALEMDGNYTRAWELKSTVLAHMGKNDEALEASKRARMSSAPSDTEMLSHSWVSESFILRQMGRDDEFLAALENATTLDPRNYDAWILLGEALQGRGEYKRRGVSTSRRSTSTSPTNPWTSTILAGRSSARASLSSGSAIMRRPWRPSTDRWRRSPIWQTMPGGGSETDAWGLGPMRRPFWLMIRPWRFIQSLCL